LEFHGNQTPNLSYLRRWSNHSATSAVEVEVEEEVEENMEVKVELGE
jgi:hypothetical protein